MGESEQRKREYERIADDVVDRIAETFDPDDQRAYVRAWEGIEDSVWGRLNAMVPLGGEDG